MKISKAEKCALEWIEKNTNILFFIAVTILGVVVRFLGRNFVSADMRDFLIPWYDEIKAQGGFKALGHQVGDYNILYQTIISLMTYLGGNCVYLYKILSIFFDFALAYGAAYFICTIKSEDTLGVTFNCVYTILVFLPTVILNSSLWGQCDSIYSFFIVLTLFYLVKEKYMTAFIFFGIAFAFKIQAIFILPFLICYYFYKKSFSIYLFGVSLLTFWLTGIFAFINGRSIMEPFKIYAHQTDTYHYMYLNVCSFWQLTGNNYDALKDIAIYTTFILCGIGLYMVLTKRKKIDTPEQVLNSATWFLWVCILFLPAMHERYTYPLDALLIMLAFVDVKYVKYALLSVLLSLITYCSYLIGNNGVDTWCILVYIAAWVHFTYTILKKDQTVLASKEAMD